MNIRNFLRKYLFNSKWTCQICGREIFNDRYFCDECTLKLPYNDDAKCNHCGRKTLAPVDYCSTCINFLASFDMCRSPFVYDKPISTLIKNFKYKNQPYLADVFAEFLSATYYKNYMSADLVTFVPMTDKAKKKRGYNQSELLARSFSSITAIPVEEVIVKAKETERQAKLNRNERLKNLAGAFRVANQKLVKDKSVLIIDDVTTTGATAEIISDKLKRAGAKRVYVLTVASVPPKNNF